jgi:hypothetical protein
VQVIVEKAERSDIPDIDKKKLVISALLLYFNMHYYVVIVIQIQYMSSLCNSLSFHSVLMFNL